MSMSKEAMKLALEALQWFTSADPWDEPDVSKAIKALEEALAKQEQGEHVAQKNVCIECQNADSWGLPDKPICRKCVRNSKWQPLNASSVNPLYATPQQRTWVGLTPEERSNCRYWACEDFETFGRAIEAKLKEKNT